MSDQLRGHAIELIDGEWCYSDTGEPTAETHHTRPCGHCNFHNTPEGHDGCLGTLPGVVNACCGHGDESTAYAQLSDGRRIAGAAVARLFRRSFGDVATGGAPVGWTIVGIGKDGSVLCDSPEGNRCRYWLHETVST